MDDTAALFTTRVTKESIAVILRTPDQLIVGHVHARPQKRLKDEMNHVSDRFLAVTDARVHDPSGSRLLYAASFVLVSYAHVVSVTPLSAVGELGDGEWGRKLTGGRGDGSRDDADLA